MRAVIFIAAVIFVTAANDEASFLARCMELLLNSDGPYAYCNVTTDTSQEVDLHRLNKLRNTSNDLLDVFSYWCDERHAYEKVNYSYKL